MKKVVIIGATSGIGYELSKQMKQKGYKVGGCGRREEILQKMETDLTPGFIGQPIDIRETDTIEIKLNQLINKLGGMDICIISSGISEPNQDLEWKLEENVFKTNILGFSAVAGFALHYFLNQNHGHLVGITSLTKYFPNKTSPAYNASKIFESNYLDSMRYKMHGKNLYVTEICPGFVDTPMTSAFPKGILWARPEQVAKGICKAIEKQKDVVYLPWFWSPIMGMLRALPEAIFKRLRL